MASWDGKHHIAIAGTGFQLSVNHRTGRLTYAKKQAPDFVNKLTNGDPTYRDSSFFAHWAQIDWQNGTKQDFFDDAGRFFFNYNTNIHDQGRVRLSPKMQDGAQFQGNVTISAITAGSWGTTPNPTVHAFDGGGNVGTWANGANDPFSWTALYTVGNPPINSAVETIDGSIWAAAGLGSANTGVGTIYRISNATGFQSSANLDYGVNVIGQTNVVSSSIYTVIAGTCQVTGPGRLLGSLNNVSSWTQIWAGDANASRVTSFIDYQQRMFIGCGCPISGPNNYVGGKIYTWDGTNVTKLLEIPHSVPSCFAVFDNLLFVGTYHGHLYVYNGSSFDLLFKFWGSNKDLIINALTVFQDRLYITVSSVGKATLKNPDATYAGVYCFNRRGINLDFKIDPSTTSSYTAPLNFNNQLLFSYGANGKVVYVNNNLYHTSGVIQGSYFDANLPSIDKLWYSMEAQYDSLSTSTSIALDYKFDESDSTWTNLGTITSVGTTRWVFPFPSGIYSKKLSYRATLNSTSAQTSSTVELRKIITKYVVKPDFYHMWDMNIEATDKVPLLDGSYEVNNGLNIEQAITYNRRVKSLVEFKDLWYASAMVSGTISFSASTIPVFLDPTQSFPLQGRLRFPSTSSELLYTSVNVSAFTGVTWNYKNTQAVSAATSTLIDNSYMTLINDISDENIFSNPGGSRLEQVMPLRLLET